MATQTSLTSDRSPVFHTFPIVSGISFNRISELLNSETDSSPVVVDDTILSEILNELTLNSVDDLPSTLHNLHQTQKRLQSQLENLAAEHYPVFLAKADASHNALKNLSNIVSANNALISRIPDLSDCAQAFLSKARILNDAIRINSKALDRHAQLLELLELPQLMETSIQNGHFDDAIAILAYAKRLVKKRGSIIPIIKIISSQVNAVGSQLIHQLCNQLRSLLSLPICIKVVVSLRRTGVFTEQELRLKFLQARTTCLINQLASGLTTPRISEAARKEIDDHKAGGFRSPNRARYEAYWRATRRVEITRVQLFDIVTQYRQVSEYKF
ncbi:conserved oligomeric Golgi complex subunit 8 [Paragonimus westermani]|uniref:Conserved oligomeric Golgi complex subunit 8 n=1 Tax=Paragonimus westermani TaxID=34504 RepID=A0A5J4NUC0_9TREM|nr:conserved oligomeric Golgi complex subunit 8 [Paragonimus westermani]